MPAPKTGPLTRAELLDVWKGAVDKGYRDPLLQAGEGNGLEVHTLVHEVLARASTAVDRTTQAMFICPWSGQSDVPAEGGRKALVTLTFARTKRYDQPLLLGKGQIFVEEQTTDFGVNGPIDVITGRRFTLLQNLVFHSGDAGPFTVEAEAEIVGSGHNNPMPGTIQVIDQPANLFENNEANVVITGPVAPSGAVATARIITPNEPDTFVPEHIGQYVVFTGGANVGRIGRIIGFTGPDLSVFPAVGSNVLIEILQTFEASVFAGTFTLGETVNFGAVARGIIVGERIVNAKKRVSYVLTHATGAADPVVGAIATGTFSGATATIQSMLFPQRFTAETGTASWRILDWVRDWGLTVTNVLAPSGGVHAWLDELGGERNLSRSSGEVDETYRQRIKSIADVVTPNAIRRALSRTLGSIPWCFREVGTPDLRGFFFDGSGAGPGGANNVTTTAADKDDAYDTDVIVLTGVISSGSFTKDEPVVLEEMPGFLQRASGFFGRLDGGVTLTLIRKTGVLPTSPFVPITRVRGTIGGGIFTATSGVIPASVNARRFRVWLDYPQFRGFFLVGVPAFSFGEFGFAYDAGTNNAYDATPYNAFYDGFPTGAAAIYSRVYQAVDTIRAGGVLWDLYRERIGCP